MLLQLCTVGGATEGVGELGGGGGPISSPGPD